MNTRGLLDQLLKSGQDLLQHAIGGDPRRPLRVKLGATRSLLARKALVAGGDGIRFGIHATIVSEITAPRTGTHERAFGLNRGGRRSS